jgi:hypothetical protein
MLTSIVAVTYTLNILKLNGVSFKYFKTILE